MKKIIIYIIGIILFTGCSDEFLDRPPLNVDNADSFWSSEKEVVLAVNSLYNAISRPMGYDIGHIVFGDVAADDMDCFDANWFIEIDNYQTKSTDIAINGQDEHTQGIWFVMYNVVFRANWILLNINDVEEISADVRLRSVNEAKFLRALAYFTLTNIFKDVPLYTSALSANEGFEIPRTSSEDVYEFVIDELHVCAGVDNSGNSIPNEGLPVKETYELGRATKGAALGLLARAYLYNGNYSMAEKISKIIIDSGEYELQEDFGANWDNTLTNGVESIFEINVEPQGQPETWAMNPGSWVVSFTVNKNFEPNQGGGWAIMVPDSNVVTLFDYAENGSDIDQRRKMTIYKGGDKYEFAPQGLQWYIPQPPTHCLLSKYSRRNHYSVPASQNLSRYLDSDTNIPLIRYAEILLIYAEACYQNGKSQEAFTYLNKVRKRAGENLKLYDESNDFMEKLMHERRIELLGEGHRFFDLRRWGKLEAVLGPEGYRAETNGYFPVPQHELDMNKNLLPQNSGYN